MVRMILTTCGTSLYNSSCWKWNELNLKPLSGASDRIAFRKRQSECEQAIIEAKKRCITGEELANNFDIESWNNLPRLRDLPAELASLKSIKMYYENPKINQPLTHDDQIVLLHPDSNNKDIDGKFCADVLKTVIINKNLLPPVLPGSIKTIEIKKLDPANREQFGEALKEVWNYARGLHEGGNSIILNLTGGYKGIGILLGAFGRQFQGIPMFYLHEEAGYDQIFMMKFDDDKISFIYYDVDKKEIIVITHSVGGPDR